MGGDFLFFIFFLIIGGIEGGLMVNSLWAGTVLLCNGLMQ